MGWTTTICDYRNRKELFDSLTRPFTGPDGARTCLKKLYRGAPWKGVLYTLWECKGSEKSERYIVVVLIKRWTGGKDGPSWGYKDMSHDMCPYNFSCPLSWLEGLSNEGSYAKKWIKCVKEYWAAKREKRPSKIMEIINNDEDRTGSLLPS